MGGAELVPRSSSSSVQQASKGDPAAQLTLELSPRSECGRCVASERGGVSRSSEVEVIEVADGVSRSVPFFPLGRSPSRARTANDREGEEEPGEFEDGAIASLSFSSSFSLLLLFISCPLPVVLVVVFLAPKAGRTKPTPLLITTVARSLVPSLLSPLPSSLLTSPPRYTPTPYAPKSRPSLTLLLIIHINQLPISTGPRSLHPQSSKLGTAEHQHQRRGWQQPQHD